MSNEFITYEGVKYRKVARKAQVGDLVNFNKSHNSVTAGRFYGCYAYDEVKHPKEVVFNDDDGDIRWPEHIGGGYLVLEPVADSSDIITVDGVKYRKVDRAPKVGDYVYVTESNGNLKQGEIHEITAIDSDGDGEFADGCLYPFNNYGRQLVERVATNEDIERELAEVKAKVSELEAKIAVQQTVSSVADEPLKVGEYAKVVGSSHGNCFGGKNGDIVVLKRGHESGTFHCERIDGFNYAGDPWADVSSLVRATPEEVAEAKKKADAEREHAVEKAKWAEIGRKVGKIRKGDVVRVIANGQVTGHKPGVIGVANRDGNVNTTNVLANGESWLNGVELIAPVESIVNLTVSNAN